MGWSGVPLKGIGVTFEFLIFLILLYILDMVYEDRGNKGQLFVRGLAPSTNEKSLELAFSKFGPIEESNYFVHVYRPKKKNLVSGFPTDN